MPDKKERARTLLREFKGDSYIFGLNCFDRLGAQVAGLGKRVSVVAGGAGKDWGDAIRAATQQSLANAGVELAGEMIAGAKPNSPRDDVFRVAGELGRQAPDVVVAIGGGSVIDAAKASVVWALFGADYPDFDSYFGVGKVTEMMERTGKAPAPLVAVQLASGSSAHLTKYSNITDVATWQKKLIIDDPVTPVRALFDYAMTATMSRAFTAEGALDGVAHALEVLMGAKGALLEKVQPVSLLAIDLIVNHLKRACEQPDNLDAREALGLGTDLGGYAIMIGGTNGAHLNSFSMVDILVHGRACALLNPYYVVFFAPAIEPQLRDLAGIYGAAGYLKSDTSALHGRELGLAVAHAMVALSMDMGFPTTLAEVDGFTDSHMERALEAAKDPQLASKLSNMPVPLSAETVDAFMGPVLQAAKTGEFEVIRNVT